MTYDKYYEYITKEGDRWDLIAYQFYGDAMMYEPIVVANPEVPIVSILPGGIKLRIPAIEIKNEIEELPPWKR
uniref:Phage tail protein n=1 Tax=Thermodesulfovibrio aggregans TaxID=86166 RepID=A0A7C4AJA2_9BACT